MIHHHRKEKKTVTVVTVMTAVPVVTAVTTMPAVTAVTCDRGDSTSNPTIPKLVYPLDTKMSIRKLSFKH